MRLSYGTPYRKMKHHYLSQFRCIGYAMSCLFVFFLFPGAKAQAQNIAAFTADNWSGCGTAYVQFINQSTASGGTASWDFGDGGAKSTLWNPTRSFNRPGTFPVTLTITFPDGATSSATHTVNVYRRPEVRFSTTPLTGCTPLQVTFTDQSSAGDGVISSINWDFGDGNGATSNTATHTYNLGGTIIATSIVTNSYGCTNSAEQVLQPNATPQVAFTSNSRGGCRVPVTVNFTNNTTLNTVGTPPAVSYLWDFGDGTTSTALNPSHDYTQEGNFTVRLTATTADGCTQTITESSFIEIATIQSNFTIQQPLCSGTALTFTNTTLPAPVSARWTFSDGTVQNTINATKTFAPGTYQVTMTAVTADGCQASVTRPFTITAPPTVNFTTLPATACYIPVNAQFTTTGTGATSWLWDFADGTTGTVQNPSHTYTAEGTYTVRLTGTSAAGCITSATNTLTIRRPQLTITGPTTGCVPLNATFRPTVTTTDPVTAYNWNFGDGTTSTDVVPQHTYTQQGTYTVTLVITTQTGCTQTATITVRVGTPVNVDFTVDRTNGCQPVSFRFTDLTTPATAGLQWAWVFQETDGTVGTSAVQNPNYVFNTIGLHDVTLTVTNNGCSRTITKPAYIEIFPPVARFIVEPTDCNTPFQRTFTDDSDFGTSTITTWAWNFGDGTTSIEQSPTHTYAAAGIYTVRLTVSNGSCTSTRTTTVRIIDQKPVIHVNANAVCLGTAVSFSVDPISSTVMQSFTWDFGNGRTNVASARPNQTYAAVGSYQVTYTMIDVYGCSRVSDPLTIEVNGSVPRFTVPTRQCKDEAITFTDLSTTRAGNTIVSWTWDFGDGSTPLVYTTAQATVSHTYSVINNYPVKLTVRDNTGCENTYTETIRIANVVANFGANSNFACLNVPFQFNNLSVAEPLTYAWTFGDGGTSTASAPAHTYTVPGTYSVTLDITGSTGCTSHAATTDFLRVPNPIADFTFPTVAGDICPPVTVQFTNHSTDYATALWSFGDGSFSNEVNPLHNYIRPGTFPVTLIVYSEGGCASPAAGPKDIVIAGPDGTFTVTPESGCSPLTVSISAVSPDAQRFIWDFGDGHSVKTTTPNSPSYTYPQEGVYYPVVLLEDARGCTVAAQGNPTVVADKITAAFTADVTQACDGGTVFFRDSTYGVSPDMGLEGTYVWDFGVPGSRGTGPTPTFEYETPGTYTVTLTVTSYYGCVQSISKDITIEPRPAAFILPVTPICVQQSVQLEGRDIQYLPDTKWLWTVNNQQYTVPVPPSLPFNQPGIYPVQLTITTASGLCSSTATENISVAAYPSLNPIPPNPGICLGESLQLQANTEAGVDITWTDYNISDPKSATPTITPTVDTTYHVTAVNSTGCSTEGSISVVVAQPITLEVSDAAICIGDAVQLHASGAVRYNWTPATGLSNPAISNPLATPTVTTTYQVTGFGEGNCFTDTRTATVTVHPLPVINAGEDIEMPVGSSIVLPVTGSNDITQIQWLPTTYLNCTDCLTPTATPRQSTTYHIQVTNAFGCMSMDDINIKLVCESGVTFLPNTFTPNGDGQNDIFYIRGKGIQSVKSFRIFNRWGQLVFERSNFNIEEPRYGWDGRLNGQLVNPDVFVYVVEMVCDTNETFTIKGNVMLLR